ncbi:PrsW family glutamic-type intramembrane protease [Pseudonocardia humida]|uniref:PrsW family intramembrane metalloprotease n=1 Tax=Pseudonocardia humida TaxID=2800819 RepID=A0ABT1A0C7_9PSEU|nr:PrsW family glutamic-type intramembrane protease [Pseudonocardia humida]MCO1656458.1 PrsW family intramembrane metalloprotease [Pseudonocardia humida]
MTYPARRASYPPPPLAARGPSALRRHGWLAVLVVGTALFSAVERTLVATDNPHLVPTAILLGAAIVPAAFLAFVYGRRLVYRVSPVVIAGSALLGGVVGTVTAGALEFDAQRDLGVLSMAGVGLIEEGSKLLVPLAVLVLFPRYRTRADGLLIGVAAGAGFAALETMGYAFTTLLQSKGSVTATVDVLLLRGLMSPAGHMAWTGIAVAALYAAAESGWAVRRAAGFLGAAALAVTLHALWDSRTTMAGTAVVAVVGLAALGWAVHRTAHVRRPVHHAAHYTLRYSRTAR